MTDTSYDDKGPLRRGSETNFEALVLGSCGFFGLSQIGVIRFLELVGYLKGIRQYLGSGCGGAICLLLNIGFTADEILDICVRIRDTIISSLGKDILTNILNGYIVNTDCIRVIIGDRMRSKGIDDKLTMKCLYEATRKRSILFVYDFKDEKRITINYKSFPNMSVLDAIVACVSIPKLCKKFVYEGKSYGDCSMSCPYPINSVVTRGNEILNVIGVTFELVGESEHYVSYLYSGIRSQISSQLNKSPPSNVNTKNFVFRLKTYLDSKKDSDDIFVELLKQHSQKV